MGQTDQKAASKGMASQQGSHGRAPQCGVSKGHVGVRPVEADVEGLRESASKSAGPWQVDRRLLRDRRRDFRRMPAGIPETHLIRVASIIGARVHTTEARRTASIHSRDAQNHRGP
jgi:hypothetical protein